MGVCRELKQCFWMVNLPLRAENIYDQFSISYVWKYFGQNLHVNHDTYVCIKTKLDINQKGYLQL